MVELYVLEIVPHSLLHKESCFFFLCVAYAKQTAPDGGWKSEKATMPKQVGEGLAPAQTRQYNNVPCAVGEAYPAQKVLIKIIFAARFMIRLCFSFTLMRVGGEVGDSLAWQLNVSQH